MEEYIGDIRIEYVFDAQDLAHADEHVASQIMRWQIELDGKTYTATPLELLLRCEETVKRY